MEKIFYLDISYSQLSVFRKGIEDPFNDWEDAHVKQGFAWRPGSVSFGSLLSDGKCQIKACVQSQVKIAENSIRTIIVPFQVLENGVSIASVTQEVEIDIPNGNYELVFNIIPSGSKEGLDIYDFSFVKTENPQAKLLVADQMLNPPDELLMEVKPA